MWSPARLLDRLGTHARRLSTLQANKPPYVMMASLGNPEPQYAGTRHNVGHWALQQLAEDYWTGFTPFSQIKGIPHGHCSVPTSAGPHLANVFLFRSIYAYMNRQGDPISKTWAKVRAQHKSTHLPALVVVHDELQVPLGKFQIRRQNTSARGHNGLRSVDSLVGRGYTKVAIGIGKPAPGHNIADYVLRQFSDEEMHVLASDVMPRLAGVLAEMAQGEHIYDIYDS